MTFLVSSILPKQTKNILGRIFFFFFILFRRIKETQKVLLKLTDLFEKMLKKHTPLESTEQKWEQTNFIC